MSLQLDYTNASSLLSQSSIDKVVRGPLYVNQTTPTIINNDDFTSSDVMVMSRSGDIQDEKASSSIVGGSKPAQNSHEWENLPHATAGSAQAANNNNFSERLRMESTTHQDDTENHRTTYHTLQQTLFGGQYQEQHNIVNHQVQQSSATPTTIGAGPSQFISSSNNSINDSDTWGTSEFATIHSSDLFKPAEERNREQSLGFHSTGRPHEAHQTHQHQHQPQLPSLATLSQPIQPSIHHHTATAAEIALGITSPYNQRSDRHISTMGDGSRTLDVQHVETSERDSGWIDNTWLQGKEDEEHTSRTSDTLIVSSPGRMTPLHDSSDHGAPDHARVGMVVGTPSTVSTAPSTDDASLGTDYRLEESMLPNILHPLGHRRSQSWGEDSLILAGSLGTQHPIPAAEPHANQNPWNQTYSEPPVAPQSQPHQVSRMPWGGMHGMIPVQQLRQRPQSQPHQRIASFRNEGTWAHQMVSPHHSHQVQYPQQFGTYQEQGQHQQTQASPGQVGARPYAQQTSAHQSPQAHGSDLGISATTTPPRIVRQARQLGPRPAVVSGAPGNTQHQPASVSQRSASEVLKTLLRKKACLYEPITSRSVALVTWLVGRELALVYGFFSRQQLQSGVHACVARKIESGTITRTKVNRCMQIILNSCFHYIIPRPDGTEEKGDYFRDVFSKSVNDDSYLLRYLPEPWNDLAVERDAVIEATLNDVEEEKPHGAKSPTTPKTSPTLGSVNGEKSPDRELYDVGDKDDSKRAVLLCFNENVRSAEDVFRCHNEFIRDTANAAHLQLTAQEWRQFFGRETSRAPHPWGNVGIPTLTGETPGGPPRQPDLFGQMSQEEVGKFRTSWCTKRYDHDHDLCGFAHVEVNGGWLRRPPAIHSYRDEMCQYVSSVGDFSVSPNHFFLNECPRGAMCHYAHSTEEILYHPNRYKTKSCTSLYSRPGGCHLGDVCPDVHPPDVNRPIKKSSESRSHGNRRKHDQGSHAGIKPSSELPAGSPVVYASPAPFSSFEHQLGLPGLQNLYRRHSAVTRAFVRTSGKAKCSYSPFGDDWGILGVPKSSAAFGAPKQARP